MLAQYPLLMLFKTSRLYVCIFAFCQADCLQMDMIAGSRATARRELRQIRKEATAAAPAVCRG